MPGDESPEIQLLVDISDAEFEDLARLVYDQFGINLTDKKKALVRGRLNKVLNARVLSNFSQYLKLVRQDETGMALVELIDRISTNHTFFFREADHFAFFLDTALGEMTAGEEIRIWCAGCATGEEAYTLAMLGDDWRSRTGFKLYSLWSFGKWTPASLLVPRWSCVTSPCAGDCSC